MEGQDHFQKTAQDNKEIKTVEQRNKITLKVYEIRVGVREVTAAY